MDRFLRFSDYDVFGYLASGITSIALCDLTFGTQFVLRESWSISATVAVILGGYVIGHVVSGAAAMVIDRGLVRRVLGTPANLLLRASPTIGWLQRAFLGEFLEPLHPSLRRRLIKRAGLSVQDANGPDAGETLFWRAWPSIKREPIPYGRADSFLKLYGFCRTMSFVSFIAALIFLSQAVTGYSPTQISDQTHFFWAIGAGVVSIVMFRRYLRFFRAYSLEVFSTFAEPLSD